MASAQRYKFQGSEVRILVDYDPEGTAAPDISAITAANPPVVTTSGAHGLEDGDIVQFSDDVGGMIELRNLVAIVNVIDTTSFEVVDVDASGYTAYTSGGHINVGVMSNWCELTNVNQQGGTATEIPASGLCSTAIEIETGLQDFGTTTFDFFFAPRTTIQQALQTAARNGDEIAYQVILPNQGGTRTQLGSVTSTSMQGGVNGLWTASATFRNSGQPYDVEFA